MDKTEAAEAYIDQLLKDMPARKASALSGGKYSLDILLIQAFYDGVHYGRTGKGPEE